MAFLSVCRATDSHEGSTELFRVERKAVLLGWPEDCDVRAFRGGFPHRDVPRQAASFGGNQVVCERHDWRFDASTGTRVKPQSDALEPYPLRPFEGELLVDLNPRATKP